MGEDNERYKEIVERITRRPKTPSINRALEAYLVDHNDERSMPLDIRYRSIRNLIQPEDQPFPDLNVSFTSNIVQDDNKSVSEMIESWKHILSENFVEKQAIFEREQRFYLLSMIMKNKDFPDMPFYFAMKQDGYDIFRLDDMLGPISWNLEGSLEEASKDPAIVSVKFDYDWNKL